MPLVWSRSAAILDRAGTWLCLFLVLVSLSGCRESVSSIPIVPKVEVISSLLSQYPMPVSVSPTEDALLLKTRHVQDFEIFVVDRLSRQILAADRSPDTQLSLTWRPDGKAIAFQESPGGNRQYSLFLLELNVGKRRRLSAPSTASAAPPLRWSPSGDRLAYLQVAETGQGKVLVFDMQNELLAAFALDSVAIDGDFGWSHDGQQIFAVSAADSGAVVVMNLKTAKRRTVLVTAGGKIGHLAWAPDGEKLLATARGRGEQFFRAFEIDLDQSHVFALASNSGDISSPLWLPNGRSFIYHVNQNGDLLPYLGFLDGSPSRPVDLGSGVNQVQLIKADGKAVVVLGKSPVKAPALYEIDLNGGKSDLLYGPTPAFDGHIVPPIVVQLRSNDGHTIPCRLWRANAATSTNNFVLIEVHGGPRIHSTPEWDAAKQFLLRQGIHVMSLDYRGSSGYGASFEEMNEETGQIEDVVAACSFATGQLKAPRRGVVLLGSSHGATLVLGASFQANDFLAAIVLIGVVATPSEAREAKSREFRVFGFHGENDSVLAPSLARLSIEHCLGARSLNPPLGHWEVLPSEGHHFHRTLSWAKVYTAILESFIDKVPPQRNLEK